MHPAIGYDDENPLIIFRTITRTLYDWHLMLELARRFEGCAEHLRSGEQRSDRCADAISMFSLAVSVAFDMIDSFFFVWMFVCWYLC